MALVRDRAVKVGASLGYNVRTLLKDLGLEVRCHHCMGAGKCCRGTGEACFMLPGGGGGHVVSRKAVQQNILIVCISNLMHLTSLSLCSDHACCAGQQNSVSHCINDKRAT